MFSKKVPLITVHDQPYLISVLSKSIEIRTDEPSVLIQVFLVRFPQPTCFPKSGGDPVQVFHSNCVIAVHTNIYHTTKIFHSPHFYLNQPLTSDS